MIFGSTELWLEDKPTSKFGYKSKYTWEQLLEIALSCPHIDKLSIHTNWEWGAPKNDRFALVREARRHTDIPILAKGYHTDAEGVQALRAGASQFLVIGRVPTVNLSYAVVELPMLDEFARLSRDVHALWNSRNLATGQRKEATFAQARALFPKPRWLCQASNLRRLSDIEPGADAVLIGECMPDIVAELKALDIYHSTTPLPGFAGGTV